VINIIEKKPEQSETNELINKLISEYMDFMGYKLTNSMFKKGGYMIKKKKKYQLMLLMAECN